MVAARSSRWPADGGAIDTLDKRLSGFAFALRLPVWAEVALSVPACCWGQPAFLFPVSTLFLVLLDCDSDAFASVARVACAALLLHLVTFAAAMRDRRKLAALYHPGWVVLGPGASLLVGEALVGELTHRPALFVARWFVSIVGVLALKDVTRRLRPCASCGVARATPRLLRAIGDALRSHDANQSFPSGDVAGAVAFALTLSDTTSAWVAPAVAIVALSMFGRLFYHAHHLLDVLAGAALALAGSSAAGKVLAYLDRDDDPLTTTTRQALIVQAGALLCLAAHKKLAKGVGATPGGS